MDKGTIQGRRFSRQDRVAGDYPHNGFGSKGSILEVGGAYLFGKPQSRVGKMPRFSGSLDCTTSDNHYCDDNAYYNSSTCYLDYIDNVQHQLRIDNNSQCDSSVYHISDSCQKPKVGKNGRYGPNTS